MYWLRALAAYDTPSAQIVVSPGKAILCAGVVSLSITAVLDADGKRKGWDASNLEVESVATEGVKFERRLFHGLFGTADQKEGMTAFVEKREPKFTDK